MTIALAAPAERRSRLDLSWPILIAFAGILVALIVLPMSWLVYFRIPDRTGALTLDNFLRLITAPTFVDPLITTVILATSSAIICCAVAAPMGWLVARTDMPLRRTIRALVTASFVTPPFLGAIAWELLAAPNSGLLNQLYRSIINDPAADPLFNIYTLPGLIFVISCYTFPYVFVLVANALDRIPGDLEDASSILGARWWVTARRVTIPLALPAVLAGALVAFLQAMTLFGSPAILAIPAGFHTMTTKIWSLFQYPPKLELAAAASLPLLALNNTVLLGVSSATIGTIMAVVIGYLTARKAITGHRALGFLATAPVAVPGIVLGVGLFLSYTRPPFVLYGTLWILLIAFVTISLPAAYQQLQSAIRAVHTDLEDASRILGATRLQALSRITSPLLRTSVIATWCFIFVGVMRELSAAIILFTSETKVISVLIFDLNESGDLGAISVLGIIMLVITFAVVIAINRIPGFGGGVRFRS